VLKKTAKKMKDYGEFTKDFSIIEKADRKY
jgi:hypothetical protein